MDAQETVRDERLHSQLLKLKKNVATLRKKFEAMPKLLETKSIGVGSSDSLPSPATSSTIPSSQVHLGSVESELIKLKSSLTAVLNRIPCCSRYLFVLLALSS